jgi:glycosyltransferase involved in cell wall biosynthesis
MNKARHPLVSVVVNNHNYASFLSEAILSALSQTYRNKEVVVVDDGSTDDSRDVINGFGNSVRPVLKTKGGQTSAMNRGFLESRGEIVIFLDADDMMAPGCVDAVVEAFSSDSEITHVHWPLEVVDASGIPNGRRIPEGSLLKEGHLEGMLREGPQAIDLQPTSGNAWHRRFLDAVMPLPEIESQIGFGSASADSCLSVLAPLHGKVCNIEHTLSKYRVHGNNDFAGIDASRKLRRDLIVYGHQCDLLAAACRDADIDADPNLWKAVSWQSRMAHAISHLTTFMPEGSTFILVDEGQWGFDGPFEGRHWLPFTEKDGFYEGPPDDDEHAIGELERMASKAGYLVIAWPSYWWKEHYPIWYGHLMDKHILVAEDGNITLFELQNQTLG